jgi:hypothetical protein
LNSQSQQALLLEPLEPHSHPGSNSVPVNQQEQEQASSSCIRPEGVSPKEGSLLQKRGIYRAWGESPMRRFEFERNLLG